jgi:IclR family transcriptional regulator, mhp operon transcriptional activator
MFEHTFIQLPVDLNTICLLFRLAERMIGPGPGVGSILERAGPKFAREISMSDAVRSVNRALQILRLMNTRPVWALGEIAVGLKLPKTTVFRLLRTLEGEGIVRSPAGSHGLYRLCSSARDLASGVTSESVLADLAAPLIIAGTKRLRWPLSVAVLDDCYMRVVFCGMPYSRLAAKTTTVNRRYWMFTSALGRAYFNFCHPVERQVIIERAIEYLQEHGLDWPVTAAQLASEMKETRRAGYSVRWAGPQDATSAMGVPIRTADELIGALVCSTYPRSLNARRIEELKPELLRVADDIAARWRDRNPHG